MKKSYGIKRTPRSEYLLKILKWVKYSALQVKEQKNQKERNKR